MTTTVDRLNVAVVGAGIIAESSHLPAWKRCVAARVIALVDPRREHAQALAERFDVPTVFTHYEEAIAHPDVDALDVCLPPYLHADCTVKALEAGKHVLLEKPFAASLQDCARILDAERSSTAKLMIAENWPYASATRQVVELLSEGAIGSPFMLRGQHESSLYLMEHHTAMPPWQLDAQAAAGGYLMNAGIHMVHLSRELMGDLSTVHCFTTADTKTAERPLDFDTVLCGRYLDGALTSMHMTGRSQHLGERRLSFALTGTAGTIEFDILRGRVAWTTDGRATETIPTEPSMGYAEEVTHFVEACTGTIDVRTPAIDQTVSLATVIAGYRSMQVGTPISPADLLEECGLPYTPRAAPFRS